MLLAIILSSLNGSAQLKGLVKKAEKAVKKEATGSSGQSTTSGSVISGPKKDFPTDGVTSPMHQKYMSKVVFSASNIEFGKENEASFITKANAESAIYFRVYMDNSQTNYLQKLLPNETEFTLTTGGMYKIFYYIDGVKCGEERVQESRFGSDEKKSFTTFRGALRSANKDEKLIGSLGYLNLYNNEMKNMALEKPTVLTPGDHKLKIEIMPYHNDPVTTGSVVASGEITITVKKIPFDVNDPNICLPKAQLVDKAIEAKLIGAFKKNGKFGTDPKAVRIVTQKWEITRNEITGRPLKRWLSAVVVVNNNGKCSYREYDFWQDHDGNSYQEDSTYMTDYSDETEISCKCITGK